MTRKRKAVSANEYRYVKQKLTTDEGEGARNANKRRFYLTLYLAIWSTVQESTASLPTGVVTFPMGAVNSGTSNPLCLEKLFLVMEFVSSKQRQTNNT